MSRPAPLQHLIESIILAVPRRRMRKASRKKLNAAVRALDQVQATRATLAKYNLHHELALWDVTQFCITYTADLTALARDMTCRRDWWENRLYARLLAMTMLECVEDLPAVLGKRFRESLASVVPDDTHRRRLSEITRHLSDFRKSHERELREIRQVAAAHRDHDPNLLMSLIDKLDLHKLAVMARKLAALQADFTDAMTEVFSGITAARLKSFSRRHSPKES